MVDARADGGPNRRLILRVPGWPGFAPGQFAMLSPGPRGDAQRTDPLLPRPMAVYRARAQSGSADVEFLYKVVGRGTQLLSEALPGQRIDLVGPLGRPFEHPPAGERAVVVAGGTGVASVYELVARAEATLLLGARTAADLMGSADFEALGIDLRVATEDGSAGAMGLVTALLPSALDADGPARVYTCGPLAMMRAVASAAAERGLPCVVSLEHHMACGFGVCLGCAAPLVEGRFGLVCRDGPIFDARDVDWERAV